MPYLVTVEIHVYIYTQQTLTPKNFIFNNLNAVQQFTDITRETSASVFWR